MQQYIRARRAGAGAPVLPLQVSDPRSYSKLHKQHKLGVSIRTVALLCAGLCFVVLVAMAFWLSTPIMKAYRTSTTPDFESEMVFDDGTGQLEKFPPLYSDEPTLTLSVIVPAYNEEERMPAALLEMLTALKTLQHTSPGFLWEIIIVNDGSRDGTASVALGFTQQETSNRVRLLQLHQNSGKGAAVRKGMMRARGHYLLMADADGATAASEISHVLDEVKKVAVDGRGVAIGSRAHLNEQGGTGGAVKRNALRKILMWGFHTFLSVMVGGGGIKDTQCGFKLFTRQAAKELFGVLHIERWAFDVELVYLAATKHVPMVEVPVQWQEMSGSKLDVVSATIQMARDIIVIRLCYMLGIWNDAAPQLRAPAVAKSAPEPVLMPVASPTFERR